LTHTCNTYIPSERDGDANRFNPGIVRVERVVEVSAVDLVLSVAHDIQAITYNSCRLLVKDTLDASVERLLLRRSKLGEVNRLDGQ
jgi:hypothetical protein